MILLDAIFVNISGGKVLLDYLINYLHNKKLNCFYLLDIRCKGSYDYLPPENVTYLSPSIFQRHNFYKKNKNKYDKILCFGNLPPTVKQKAKVFTYFHNLLFLITPKQYPIKDKLIKKIKFLIVNFFKKNSDYFIVQSENVKKKIIKKLNIDPSKCLVFPFYDPDRITYNPLIKKNKNIYLYVSDGNPHKNHENLFKAWEIFNQNNSDFELHLTISNNYPDKINQIHKLQKQGLKIINHHNLYGKSLNDLYNKAKYCVYPSLAESFGLGLIEAVDCKCEIIASDLPYVNEIVDPLSVFDPNSPDSIADSIFNAAKGNDLYLTKKKIKNKISDLITLLQ